MFGAMYTGQMMAKARAAMNPKPGFCECPQSKSDEILNAVTSQMADVKTVCMKCNKVVKPVTIKKKRKTK